MAEEKIEPREINFRQWLPWTQIFRGFWIALDHKKLLLAAAGIVVMALGWWFFSIVFYKTRHEPKWGGSEYTNNWEDFKKDRERWNLLYEAAGDEPLLPDENDLATNPTEFTELQNAALLIKNEKLTDEQVREQVKRGTLPAVALRWIDRTPKPYGKLRTWPWFEDRGPNPLLLVTGHEGQPEATGLARYEPWRRGQFTSPVDWFITEQLPVLVEPLVKLFRPVRYFMRPNAGFLEQFYFLLVIIWTVGTWAIFGGAITRIAAVEITRNEKIGMGEALRFVRARWKSYVFASFLPLIIIAGIVLLLALFGAVNWIPFLAEIWNGLLWFLALGGGLAIAVLLVGLIGWPMIHATLSTEGSDSFDALSRSYSYVLLKPWSYLWYAVVALAYGAVIVFFVGLMGSLTIYLAKWGSSQFTSSRGFGRYSDPSPMFIWQSKSFGSRDLLLHGSPIAADTPTDIDAAISAYTASPNFSPSWYYIGAFLIAAWLYLFFLLVVGYGYSYFWSAGTMIYLLMRRKADDTEMDEVYLEEEDSDEPYSTTAPATSVPPAASSAPAPMQLVEPPTLRQPAPTTAAPSSPAGSSQPKVGDGEAAPSGGTPA